MPTLYDGDGKPSQSFSGENRDSLLRMLIDTFPEQTGRPDQFDVHAVEEILLDVELDGGRYLLVRLPTSSQTPVPLSPREQEVVRMVADGHPNKVIAAVLNISCWTVCTHLRRVFAKLNVTSRAAMVARYLESRGTKGESLHSSTSVRRSSIPDPRPNQAETFVDFPSPNKHKAETPGPEQSRYRCDRGSVLSGTKE